MIFAIIRIKLIVLWTADKLTHQLLTRTRTMKINWNWPQTKTNKLLPWYVILKNLMALPFMLLGIVFGAVYVGCMGIAYLIVKGRSYAQEWVKDELYGYGVY
jgi:hypothetical protein